MGRALFAIIVAGAVMIATTAGGIFLAVWLLL
jgi:hypothetical protein